MARSSVTTDLLGFLLGFFFGCCGLVFAVFWMRDYTRGVVLGIVAQMLFGFVIESSNAVMRMPLAGSGAQPFPWELVAAFVIATVFVFGTIAGAIWAFGGHGDDDDDGPPPPPEPDAYVTFSRR